MKPTGARLGIGNVLLGVDKLLQFLLLGQRIGFGLVLLFHFLLAFVLLQLAAVLVLLGDDVLQYCLFVKQESLLTGTNTGKLRLFFRPYYKCRNYSRYDRIATWLKRQRTTVETLDRVLADTSMIGSVSGRFSIPFLLVVRVHSTGSGVSSVASHLFWIIGNSSSTMIYNGCLYSLFLWQDFRSRL